MNEGRKEGRNGWMDEGRKVWMEGKGREGNGMEWKGRDWWLEVVVDRM